MNIQVWPDVTGCYRLEVISALRYLLQCHTLWLHKSNVVYSFLGSKPGYLIDATINSNSYMELLSTDVPNCD